MSRARGIGRLFSRGRNSDPVESFVQQLYTDLMIDDEWAVRPSPREFTWWPFKLAQRVWAGPEVPLDDTTATRLHIETDLLTGVHLDKVPELHKILSMANSVASLSALVHHPDTGRVTMHCAVNVTEDSDEAMSRLAAVAAVLQMTEAFGKADLGFAKIGPGVKPAWSNHPTSGPRHRPDDLMGATEQVVLPVGRLPSRFGAEDFRMIEQLAVSAVSLGGATKDGFVAEVPFTGDTPAFVQAATLVPSEGMTALLTCRNEDHPGYGSGAVINLRVPADVGDRAYQLAADLNHAEATVDYSPMPAFGAWCVVKDLAHVVFLPSAHRHPDFLPMLGMISSMRGQLAQGYMAGHGWL
jgi:hypothetical protein